MKKIISHRRLKPGFILPVLLFVVCIHIHSQPLQWYKRYGGSGMDQAELLLPLSGGGYLLLGSSRSVDGDVTVDSLLSEKSLQLWLVKTDALGNLEWERSYGGSGEELLFDAYERADGNIILVGQTQSNNGDFGGNLNGGADLLIVSISPSGNINWYYTYGGSKWESAYGLIQTPDKGMMIVGTASSSDGNVSPNQRTV